MLQRINERIKIAEAHSKGEITWEEAMDRLARVETAYKLREMGLDKQPYRGEKRDELKQAS